MRFEIGLWILSFMAVAQAAPSMLEKSNIVRSTTTNALVSRDVTFNTPQVGVRIDDRRFEPALVGGTSKVGWYFDKMVMPSTAGVKPEYGLSYVPTFYSPYDVQDLGLGFISTEKWGAAKVTHVMGFYKPADEDRGEALITPKEAAKSYKALGLLLGGKYKIGSPAVVGSNKIWMNEWMATCDGGCRFDFVPLVYHGVDVMDLIRYVEDFSAEFKKPLWLIDLSCQDTATGQLCEESRVKSFMQEAIDYFRSSGKVERWAWSGSSGSADSLVVKGGDLTPIGQRYVVL